MKKLIVCLLAAAMGAGAAYSQTTNYLPTMEGSLLVFPLIDNTGGHRTLVNIVNRGDADVWLECVIVASATGEPEFLKEDFCIHLTAKEPLLWDSSRVYNRADADGVITQIRSYSGVKGFFMAWAVDSCPSNKVEKSWNYLTGDALTIGPGNTAFSYQAYLHQALTIVPDRVLNLDAAEYTMAPCEFLVEGLAAGIARVVGGKLVVVSPSMDFVRSLQPCVDVNFNVWNQDETFHSRHGSFCQFAEFDLATDLNMTLAALFTPKWQMTASTRGNPNSFSGTPMWAILVQTAGPSISWGGNVFQSGAFCNAPARIVLAP
jgi:hypothetical protein